MGSINDQTMDAKRLRDSGIRPTSHRLTLMRLIREGGRRHLTPESFHRELEDSGKHMSLATVYNTLNQLSDGGILRRVGFGERTYFCTNPSEHHHFFDETTGRIEDIPGPQPQVIGLPEIPPGMSLRGVEVIIRLRRN